MSGCIDHGSYAKHCTECVCGFVSCSVSMSPFSLSTVDTDTVSCRHRAQMASLCKGHFKVVNTKRFHI